MHDRRLDSSPLATVIRLCLLQLTMPHGAVVEALSPEGVDALLATGLVTQERGALRPRARILPVEDLFLAFDGFARGADDPAGFVAPFTPTASWLAALTPRRAGVHALDVGTGNGVHALLAARHHEHVIATDVNPRALAFTEINAALSGIANVETRRGSLFDPVAGEQFDLITCNAPYVVSPESRWQYRDGGLPADDFSRRVVEHAAGALAADGYSSVLVSWVAESEDEPDDRLDEWTAYFERIGVGWISEGAVLLHRREAGTHLIRLDSAEPDDLEFAGPQILRAFAAQARIAELDRPESLLDATLKLAREVRIDYILEPHVREGNTVLTLEEGTHTEYELDPDVAEVVKLLDGTRTLGRAIDRVVRTFELDKRETAELRRDTLEEAEDLLALGIAELLA